MADEGLKPLILALFFGKRAFVPHGRTNYDFARDFTPKWAFHGEHAPLGDVYVFRAPKYSVDVPLRFGLCEGRDRAEHRCCKHRYEQTPQLLRHVLAPPSTHDVTLTPAASGCERDRRQARAPTV